MASSCVVINEEMIEKNVKRSNGGSVEALFRCYLKQLRKYTKNCHARLITGRLWACILALDFQITERDLRTRAAHRIQT
jgi:hypothetical protein